MNLIHGGDVYSARQKSGGEPLDFSANINPLGMPPGVVAAAAASLQSCVHYPDPLCRELRAAIAEREHVPVETVVCGNGAADLIFRLAMALRPKKALLPAPTFAEYEQALSSVGCGVSHVLLREETGFALEEDFLQALTPEIDLAFFCNPNNPTGRTAPRELLQKLLARCLELGIVVVMDECFNDFLEEPERHTLRGMLQGAPNLVLIKAFTKSYAMPGLRLGYCLCGSAALAEQLFACAQPWGVSIPAQAAGIAALRETTYLERMRRLIETERVWLSAQLRSLGCKVYPAEANYILFRTETETPLREQMQEQGVLIRSCGNYRGLDGRYYRVAVRSHEENERLISALRRVWKE